MLSTQQKQVIDYCSTGKAISSFIASDELRMAPLHLHKRVSELKRKGYVFSKRRINYTVKATGQKKYFHEYRLTGFDCNINLAM